MPSGPITKYIVIHLFESTDVMLQEFFSFSSIVISDVWFFTYFCHLAIETTLLVKDIIEVFVFNVMEILTTFQIASVR